MEANFDPLISEPVLPLRESSLLQDSPPSNKEQRYCNKEVHHISLGGGDSVGGVEGEVVLEQERML